MAKNKGFFKAFGLFAVIALLLAYVVLEIVGVLFPALLPDWVLTVSSIISIPFWVAFFIIVFKEWRTKCVAQKTDKNKCR